MTLVEFFEVCPCHNIISTTAFVPDRVIFLGSEKTVARLSPLYEAYYRKYHPQVAVIFRATDTTDLNATVEALSAIICEFPDAEFDVTGGDDLVLIAMGIVRERYRDRTFGMHRFDIARGTASDPLKNQALALPQPPSITVEQAVTLCGGIVSSTMDGAPLQKQDLTGVFGKTVDRMWAISCEDPHRWNKAITGLNRLEKLAPAKDSPLHTVIPKHVLSQDATQFEPTRAILTSLDRCGILSYREHADALEITYPDHRIKGALAKAGNVLEYKTLRLAQCAVDADGKPFFADARCGVYIDWDGRFGINNATNARDTINEIDVIATRGVVPWFISCKNGTVDDEELYKFTVVARRFGGRYAKAVLVATYIDRNPAVRARLLQRAADMHIVLVDRVHERSDEEWTQALCSLAK